MSRWLSGQAGPRVTSCAALLSRPSAPRAEPPPPRWISDLLTALWLSWKKCNPLCFPGDYQQHRSAVPENIWWRDDALASGESGLPETGPGLLGLRVQGGVEDTPRGRVGAAAGEAAPLQVPWGWDDWVSILWNKIKNSLFPTSWNNLYLYHFSVCKESLL